MTNMQMHPKMEYNTEKLLPKIKLKFSNIPIKIEDKELEGKEFKEFPKLHYSFDMYKIDTIFIIEGDLNDEKYKAFAVGSYNMKTNIPSLFLEWDSIPKYEVEAASEVPQAF